MKATINTSSLNTNIQANRKESKFCQERTVFTIKNGRIKDIMTAKFYATGAKHYCCFWLTCGNWNSGGGNAGGYGYHRGSAAFEAALNDAGITLSKSISGAGESAMDEAMRAIALELGYEDVYINVAHP